MSKKESFIKWFGEGVVEGAVELGKRLNTNYEVRKKKGR